MKTREQPTRSEAEETLAAIRAGRVDALVVAGPNGGNRTVSIDSATHPYVVLLDAMGDGSALLDPDGSILFGNQTFSEIAQGSDRQLIGSAFQKLFAESDRETIDDFLRTGSRRTTARDFTLIGRRGGATPVSITISRLPLDANRRTRTDTARRQATILMVIVTDLTARRTADATRAKLLERLISAEDEERRRIARELHDETGQSLAALQVGLRVIADHAESSQEVRKMVLRLRDVAAGMVGDVSRLARGLHPAVLDDNGLAAAAATYVADYARSHKVKVSFVVGDLDSPRLVPFAAATVYRILQEALTNVARHARATRIAVKLTRDDEKLGLVVRDNGVGFDATLARGSRSGLGLRGMQERVALLRGSIRIDSVKRQGTTVRASIPLERGA